MLVPAIIPGLHDSSDGHWQTWLENILPGSFRVEQPDWTTPDLQLWSAALGASLSRRRYPTTLIAHSFGCLAAVRCAAVEGYSITSALLVAPDDPDRFGIADAELEVELPFRTTLVASRNDPWISFDRARWWANRWGSRLVDMGYAGHINIAAGYGPWPQALRLISELNASTAHPIAASARTGRLGASA